MWWEGLRMIGIQYEADVHCTAEELFDVILDLRGYDRWLAASNGYRGITDISSDPVTLGTTYVEPGRKGVRHGTITELEPPTKIVFHQPMIMTPRFLGIVDIRVHYTLTPTAASTHVRRLSTPTIPWPLKPAQPVILRELRFENERTLLALKAFADSLSPLGHHHPA
jgi:uncharacterized protein YndB with AHSA1/START domain